MTKQQITDNKENIVRDFGRKRSDYFEKSYATVSKGNYLRRLRWDMFLDRISTVKSPRRVLDIGGGPAILYPELLEKCEQYFAVDLVKTNLEEIRLKHRDRKLECICKNLDSFVWKADYFDVIICSGAIEYTNEAEANLSKLINCLRRGGLLICSFPNAASPHRVWSEFVYRPVRRLVNGIRGKKEPSYKRRLFGFGAIKARLATENVKYSVIYQGYQFLLQPMDSLFRDLDYRLSKHLQEHPNRLLEKLCSEFTLTITK